MVQNNSLKYGSILMLIGSLSFILYAIAFFFRSFLGKGFEIGVETLNGATKESINAFNAAIVPYITHLHIAVSGFIAATGIAVAALSWYGVKHKRWWAWIAAVISPVVGLAVALPMHYFNYFNYNWVFHLGPIYLGTLIFIIGALISLNGLLQKT